MHNDNDINQHYTSSMPDEIDWLLSNAGGGGKRDGSGLDQFRVGPTQRPDRSLSLEVKRIFTKEGTKKSLEKKQ